MGRMIPPGPPDHAFDRGMEGSELAARKWTPLEALTVDRAIDRVARKYARFTADEIWRELAGSVPVTKGLAGRLVAAQGRNTIYATGDVTSSQREGIHGHGQRLGVWGSNITGNPDPYAEAPVALKPGPFIHPAIFCPETGCRKALSKPTRLMAGYSSGVCPDHKIQQVKCW